LLESAQMVVDLGLDFFDGHLQQKATKALSGIARCIGSCTHLDDRVIVPCLRYSALCGFNSISILGVKVCWVGGANSIRVYCYAA
jgi:hypothetical protein